MLFNSYEFLFAFLPVVFGGFLALSALSKQRAAATFLVLASLYFYAFWAPQYLLLLLCSIAFNFHSGKYISRAVLAGKETKGSWLLVISVSVNLLLLAYYKYANFLLDIVAVISHSNLPALDIILPIGISFFTFTQIAFLVDCKESKVKEHNAINYLLFVSYFPHLIAGPVLHHAEMMPQFGEAKTYRFVPENFIAGLTFFVIGLFKKVVLADGIQPYVGPVFDSNEAPSFFSAWGGALAYTLQLYFDFSAYSDMAIGLSKMFNVDLPLNFNSPYKAKNISDFWRRWHMTLSRFLRDYLYIRLGGNQKGVIRRYLNLLITMLLGGLWHGAGWTFVIWGGLHGLFLIVNHSWIALKKHRIIRISPSGSLGNILAVALTFISVVIAWVFFRATNLDVAIMVLSGMVGQNGIAATTLATTAIPGNEFSLEYVIFIITGMNIDWRQISWIGTLLSIAWFLPNSQQIIERYVIAPDFGISNMRAFRWVFSGVLIPILLLLTLINGSRDVSEFIYFNF